MADIVLDINKTRFRDALREYISDKNDGRLIKVDDFSLIGLYSRAGKYVVCDSTWSNKTDFKYSISDRLEFDDLDSAERYYNECRDIVTRQVGRSILDAMRV